MRTLAIGDIHGALPALNTLLTRIALRSEDWLIFLGDYIDRGPDSAGVLRTVSAFAQRPQTVFLRGNHEQLMLDARLSFDAFRDWLLNGGDATMKSYGGLSGSLREIPDDHWQFLEKTVNYYETATHMYVHATAQHDLPLSQQTLRMLQWGRFNDPPPHISGKVLICGHTPQTNGKPRNLGHAVCIDTFAHHPRGWLTCMDTDARQIWQANNAGQTRSAKM